jgi:hypothetical protein
MAGSPLLAINSLTDRGKWTTDFGSEIASYIRCDDRRQLSLGLSDMPEV